MKIEIKVIPHNEQAYETVGNWWLDNEGTLQIRVSQTGNTNYNFLIAIHELVESLTCLFRRTRSMEVLSYQCVSAADAFDKHFEKTREEGNTADEPGYDILAPYYQEHMIASALEHNIAALLHVDYNRYNRAVANLSQEKAML